jgi:hypothetical protein
MLKIFNYSIFSLSKTRGENALFKDNFTIPHRYRKSYDKTKNVCETYQVAIIRYEM